MSFKAASQAADVVDDDDELRFPVSTQIGEHVLHAGPPDDASRHIVLENLHHGVTAILRVFAASRFLAGETVAACCLLRRANPAVDYSLFLTRSRHGSVLFTAPIPQPDLQSKREILVVSHLSEDYHAQR